MKTPAICVLQTDIVWASPQQNRLNAEEMLMSAPHSNVYLLPEMFTTGFATQPRGIAECTGTGMPTLQWMQAMASKLDAAVAGSVSVEENGLFFNRFFFVMPDGSCCSYDKRHLFTHSGEHLNYEYGRKRVIVPFRGVRYLLAVCYDLRFPVWMRNRGDYDAILCVASWPEQRTDAWKALLKARAIENQCFVAAANRYGDDPGNHYSGASAIIGPYGNTITQIEGRSGHIEAVLDMDKLNEYRLSFPVLDDADSFELI